MEMAEGATSLKGLRAQMAAAAQAQAEERRSLAGNSPGPPSPAAADTPSPAAAAKSPRPVIDGAALRIDDRLRVAKERREEADRQQATKDTQILERERKAKLQVERQMEERQKKLDEQRRKEEQRRSAVEEKRKQKQEEEKEHYEAVMRRTLERSQRVEQRQKRWSWGGLSESDNRPGDPDAGSPSPIAIVISPASPGKPPRTQADKRSTSTSTMNLKQPADSSINKRLSSSSATLINSPDKKCHLCPRSASASPLNPMQRGPLRSRSIDRQKSATLPTSASADQLNPSLKEKRFSSPGGKRPASPSNIAGRHRSPSPAPLPASKRTPSPSAAKQSPRNRPPSPGGIKHRPPSPQLSSAKPPSPQPTSAKPPPIQRPALTPTGPPTLRKKDSKPKDLCPIQAVAPQSPEPPQTSTTPTPTTTTSSKTKDKDDKSMAGTNSAAEAAMILAENRRLAREKKEREEALRVLREEEEKLRKEEEKRLAEEARLKRLEEERRLAEERKKKEEEDALMAEADRERLEAEEAERQAELQKEREEAEAQAAIDAEKVRIERERVMAQNQQERMERKKRIEEIMKRTRKGEQEKRDEDDDDDDDDIQDEEGEEEGGEEETNCDDTKDDESAQTGDVALETDGLDEEERGLIRSEPMGVREEPLGSVNGKPEADDKENSNRTSAEEPLAVSPVPKGCLVGGSEFLNEDSNMLAPGLNGKPGPWSFEELIDLGVNSKGRPLINADGHNQGLIDCDGSPEGPRVAFEDKGTPVATLHPSSQPIEALSEM
ncbi:MAP7 domain-containing protein 2-like isoform X9 [Coregonus clupeaformis]|uniref:MAP7 domain-containing protein 2-like isoform X9 n=1 Tax=Coregonus clupeaformis TaxID=59861 RepID=UPI001E1C7821|nr:MAP7 domain-containing protein 2-like isoform X9 [Coregonus clupeaformis]